jgi:hypothetical protein
MPGGPALFRSPAHPHSRLRLGAVLALVAPFPAADFAQRLMRLLLNASTPGISRLPIGE